MINSEWVWVIGASSGIGKALAKAFAQQGFKLILSSRNAEKLEELKNQFSVQTEVIPFDLSNEQARIDAVAIVKKISPSIHYLVHSAGVSQRALAEETSLSVVKNLFELNFFGLIELNRLSLPLLNSGSTVVVISSLVGKFSTPLRTAYAASKHALEGYFEGLRYEWKPKGIHVCVVNPGYIKTNISIHALTKDGKPFGKMDKNQENGISANDCAQEIIRGLKKRKTQIIVGKSERWGLLLKRFFPRILEYVIQKRF